jgi:hypothetical protein
MSEQKQQLPMPVPTPVIRENGDAVVEMRQDGQLVGELNFSAILGNWFDKLGWGNKRSHLHSIK